MTPGVFSGPGVGCVQVAYVAGRSVVTQAYATSPLRLLTPRNHGDAAWIFTSSFGGGFVDQDHTSLDLTIGDGAAAFISTQASSKVYRSPRGTGARLIAQVGRDALLVVAPDPVVPFAGASFEQDQRFVLDATGSLILVDWVSSGRRESGERWRFRSYVNRLAVDVDEAVVLRDALALRHEDGELSERMGRFNILTTVLVLGRPLLTYAATLVTALTGEPVEKRPAQLAVATLLEHKRLGEVGCLVRMAGATVDEVGRAIRTYLRFVPDLLGDDPWGRKW